jgi:signal peptidase II
MTIDGPSGVTETAAGEATGPTVTATRRGAHWVAFVGIAAVIAVLDQLTKAWLVSTVAPGEVKQVAGDAIRLIFTRNSGALFGLFRDNALIFGVVSLGVVGMIVLYHARSGRSRYLSIALGLLLGGALGNVTDRLRLGYVVDFVDVGIGDLRWYTFNLADAAISTAIVLLVAAAFIPALAALVDGDADG